MYVRSEVLTVVKLYNYVCGPVGRYQSVSGEHTATIFRDIDNILPFWEIVHLSPYTVAYLPTFRVKCTGWNLLLICRQSVEKCASHSRGLPHPTYILPDILCDADEAWLKVLQTWFSRGPNKCCYNDSDALPRVLAETGPITILIGQFSASLHAGVS